MKIAKFGDIAELIQDRIAPKEDNTGNYIGLENLPSESLLITTWQSDVIPDSDKFLFKKGDVLFARRRAYQKKVGVAPFDGIISTDGMVFRPKPNIYGSLLPFIVKSDHFMNYAINNSAGTMSPRVKWKDLQNCEIKIPENELQKKYSDLLWHLENTIILLNERLTILDQLVKSRFIELFKDCPKDRLGDHCTTHARIGWQKLTRKEFLDSGDFYLITGWDIMSDHSIAFKQCYYVSKERYEQDPKLILHEGDVLLTKDGTIGKVGIITTLDKPATLNGHIFVIRSKTGNLLPRFLAALFETNDFKKQIESNRTGSTITGITQKALLEFTIPIASIENQKEFIEYVQQVDKSKFELQKHLDDTKRLQKALINQAFDPKLVQN